MAMWLIFFTNHDDLDCMVALKNIRWMTSVESHARFITFSVVLTSHENIYIVQNEKTVKSKSNETEIIKVPQIRH